MKSYNTSNDAMMTPDSTDFGLGINDPTPGALTFWHMANGVHEEYLRFEPDGRTFVRGQPVTAPPDIYSVFSEWLHKAGEYATVNDMLIRAVRVAAPFVREAQCPDEVRAAMEEAIFELNRLGVLV